MPAPATLVVHVPALEKLLDEAGSAPEPIPQMLARARSREVRADCPWARALGLPEDLAAGPLARLGSAGEGPKPDSDEWWMCADAVELVPDLTAVWIRGPARLPQDQGDESEPSRELAQLFAMEGIEFVSGNDQGGSMKLPGPPECRFTPPAAAYGKRLDRVLPKGADAGRWHRLFNECQMIIHQHLDAPAATGPGCGLWFWGAGRLPKTPEPGIAVDIRAGGDPVLAGLSRWLKSQSEPDASPAARLVHWPADPALGAADNLRRLTKELLQPAWAELKRGRLRRLVLTGSASVHELGRLAPWALWRRAPREAHG